MSKLWESIRTTAANHIQETALTIAGTLLITWLIGNMKQLGLYLSQYLPYAIHVLLWLLLISTLLILSLSSWIYSLKKKLKNPMSAFEFDKKTGVIRNKKDGLYYCISCLHKNIKSPLQESEKGWKCLNIDCGIYYKNPEYKEPPKKPRNHLRYNFVTDKWTSI